MIFVLLWQMETLYLGGAKEMLPEHLFQFPPYNEIAVKTTSKQSSVKKKSLRIQFKCEFNGMLSSL